MTTDIRVAAAEYYDVNPNFPDDIGFYQEIIPNNATILELGCGTGRILLSLTKKCRYIYGIDISDAMLSICRMKLKAAGIPPDKACAGLGDIAQFSLDQKFDFIIAPFRVLQNLELETEVDGFFRCLRKHLSSEGSCVLNVFNPIKDPVSLEKEWHNITEDLIWEIPYGVGILKLYVRKSDFNLKPLILYPEMIYRYYENDNLKKEAQLKIAMRCYYAEEFERLIIDHGFRIINKWGGYSDETYGEGPELIIQFQQY